MEGLTFSNTHLEVYSSLTLILLVVVELGLELSCSSSPSLLGESRVCFCIPFIFLVILCASIVIILVL